jgi:hypothetical protein
MSALERLNSTKLRQLPFSGSLGANGDNVAFNRSIVVCGWSLRLSSGVGSLTTHAPGSNQSKSFVISYLFLAQRVGFVPRKPDAIKRLGPFSIAQNARTAQQPSIRHKTGTANPASSGGLRSVLNAPVAAVLDELERPTLCVSASP